MSSDINAERQQQKIREFMQLLPLTMAIAGLPQSDLGRNFNEGQMEVRGTLLRTAFKIAKQTLADLVAS